LIFDQFSLDIIDIKDIIGILDIKDIIDILDIKDILDIRCTYFQQGVTPCVKGYLHHNWRAHKQNAPIRIKIRTVDSPNHKGIGILLH